MTRVGPAFTSFNAGEFGRRMDARVDFSRYTTAAARMENILALPQGGMTRRPGTRYIAEVASSAARSRLKGFEYSTVQAYMLELSASAVRFYREQAQIGVDDTDASITNGDFTSNITGWTDQSTSSGAISHDSTNGRLDLDGAASSIAIAEQQVSIGASYRSTDHVLVFRILGAPGDVVYLRIGSTSGNTDIVNDFVAHVGWHAVDFNPATNASVYIQFRNEDAKTRQVDDVAILDAAALQIGSPWSETELQYLKFAQNADVMYAARGGTTPVYRLERYGDLRWSLEEVLFTDGPYLDENTTATTMTPGAASGFGITMTASAVTGINGDTGFQTTDVGRLIRVYNSDDSQFAWGVITARTSTTVVTVDLKGDQVFKALAQSRWMLGEWSATTGYPSVVSFVQQRLGFASTTTEPQKFWLSQSASIEDFTPDDLNGVVEADDAINYRLAAEDVNTIVSMSYRRRLILGTIGGEWSVESEGVSLAPADIDAVPQTSYGVSETVPFIKARNRQLFVQRAGRQLYEFGYSFNDDAFQGRDLTVLNDRVLTSGVREAAYAQQPDSIIWLLREDGVLAAQTYQPDQEIAGWSRHIVGGAFGSGNAVVESVATIPGTNGSGQVKDSTGRDEVWVIVKRTINGGTKRYVEIFEKLYNGDEDDQEDAYCFDSLLTYDGSSAETISGLDHLEGETVKVWADGALQTDKTVASGQITLDRAASVVQVGLGFRHRYKSLQLAYGARGGSALGKSKSVTETAFTLMETAENAVEYGADPDSLSTLETRMVADATTLPAPLFTGQTEMDAIQGAHGPDPRLYIEGGHGPCTILAVPFDIDLQERQ